VTGGTGTLGHDVIPALDARGIPAVVLSRRPGPDIRVGDLDSGEGVAEALDGIETVIHLAAGRTQPREARTLVSAGRATSIRHLVFISIVGIDEIPFGYYRAKRAAERVIEGSGLPATVLRTTQFHQFVAGFFSAQRFSPVVVTPALSVQPIDTKTVADRLVELAVGPPSGRVSDLGGPEVLTGREIAWLYQAHRGWRRPTIPFGLPGATWAAFAQGYQLVPKNRSGGRTFAQFLATPAS